MSIIFASSTCDFSNKLLKKVGVEVINLPIKVNDKKCLYDSQKFNFDEYYANPKFEIDEVNYKKQLLSKFTEALNTGQDVLFMTCNAKFDVSYKHVRQLFKELSVKFTNQKLEIVNCNNLSMGYGLIVYEAGIKNRRGESLTEVVKFINKFKKSVKTYIIPSTNKIIKEKLNVVGDMIGARSLLEMVDGELKVLNNVRGKTNIVKALLGKTTLNSENVPITIMYGKNSDEAIMLENKIDGMSEDVQIIKSNLNPIVTNTFGDRTLVLSLFKKSRL